MLSSKIIKPMTQEESYVHRRQLFKNIWQAAMHLDEKDDILNKTKVIKTLRMDEIDKCPVGKTKKQRIKNLRHVCNRILDFCDRQEADDQFYKQAATDEQGSPSLKTGTQKVRKLKTRHKRKVKKAKSMFVPQTTVKVARLTTSVRQHSGTDISSISQENRNSNINTAAIKEKKLVRRKGVVQSKNVTIICKADEFPKEIANTDINSNKRKLIKKKYIKKSKNVEKKIISPHINL